jgi:hypothetical protein
MMLAPDATGQWTPMPVTPGKETEPGFVVYRFGADLFYANDDRFADEVRALVERAPTPIRWLVVDAGAITDIDYSAAQSLRDLIDDLGRQRVGMVFARVSPYLRSDMDRHRIAAATGEAQIFTTLYEAVMRCVAARSGCVQSDDGRRVEPAAAPDWHARRTIAESQHANLLSGSNERTRRSKSDLPLTTEPCVRF